MKISNSQEANQYYKIINDLVDQYIKKWKIKPSSLYKYLKPGSDKFESFILNSGLSGIDGIKRIVQDVIEDRKHMELDGILKFESFKYMLNESSFNINKANIEHEKILADYFNTSLGHIELIDTNSHIYKITDFGEVSKCVIYSKEEINEIEKNITNAAIESIKKELIVIDKYLPNNITSIKNKIDITIGDIISEEKFIKIFKEKIKQNILSIISEFFSAELLDKYKEFYLWKIMQHNDI